MINSLCQILEGLDCAKAKTKMKLKQTSRASEGQKLINKLWPWGMPDATQPTLGINGLGAQKKQIRLRGGAGTLRLHGLWLSTFLDEAW